LVWPAVLSDRFMEITVLENIASWTHILFALAVTLVAGCARRVFWLYTLYQLVTTAAKTLTFPEHTLADWSWDFFGDTLEFLMGMGLAYALGINDRVRPEGFLARACSWRGILVGYAALWIIWLVAYVTSLG